MIPGRSNNCHTKLKKYYLKLNNLNLPHNYNKSCTNDYDATATKSELIEAILWGLEILF